MKRAAFMATALALMPLAHADIFAVYETGRSMFALSTLATGSCQAAKGWRNGYFVSFGKIPSCWSRKDNVVTICPIVKGHPFKAEGCAYVSAEYFTDVNSLPKTAVFPQ